jgi:hypothetical protein
VINLSIGNESISLSKAIVQFDDGKLSQSEIIELFQQILDFKLKGEVSSSMANAADVYLRHGICILT